MEGAVRVPGNAVTDPAATGGGSAGGVLGMEGLAGADELRGAVGEIFGVDAAIGGVDDVVHLGGGSGAAAGDLKPTCGGSAQDAKPELFGEASGALAW